MGKSRSLKQQARFALVTQKAFGQKKHAAPQKMKEERINSFARYDGIQNTSDQFMAFMKENFPEIKWLREITNTHAATWMASKHWRSKATFDETRSRLSKLQTVCEAVYGKCRSPEKWGAVNVAPPKAGKIRDVAMTRTDFVAVRDSIKAGRSDSWLAMEIAARTGLRVREVHWLSGQDIDIEKNTVFVCKQGAKNGRARTIPIRPQDRDFFKWLKARTPSDRVFRMKNGRVLLPDSIDDAMRLHMKKLGLSGKYQDTTLHSVRKMYAIERMEELRGPTPLPDFKMEMAKFDIVSAELGHGKGRVDLYRAY